MSGFIDQVAGSCLPIIHGDVRGDKPSDHAGDVPDCPAWCGDQLPSRLIERQPCALCSDRDAQKGVGMQDNQLREAR